MTGILFKNRESKDIVTGILACAIIIAAIYLFPLLGIFALTLLPLPVLFYRLKLGRNAGGIIMASGFAILIAINRGPVFDILYLGSMLITGFLLGEFMEKLYCIEKTIIYTCIGVFLICSAMTFLYSSFRNQSVTALVSEYISKYFSLTAQLYSEMGVPKEKINVINSWFALILPGIFTVSFASTAWLNILIIKKILSKKGVIIKSIENLNLWRAPHSLVWAVILISLSFFVQINALKYFSINIMIVLMLVYFFQGIAIVSFYFEKKKLL